MTTPSDIALAEPHAGNNHFSTDLVANSFKHTYFLMQIHSLGVSKQRQDIESLRRYKNLWLPLVNAYGQQRQLIPPPDIAWLWHCHRLAPRDYIKYSKQEFGCILEANPPFALQLDEGNTKSSSDSDGGESMHDACSTRQLWRDLYPNEPFFRSRNENGNVSENDDSSSTLLAGFDLLASTERQSTFLWQVSGERFDDVAFLNEGVENYYKFLSLKPQAQAKGTILVPTYQIDLMWHTHILSSIVLYNKDCQAIAGSTFHHDDSLNDRTEGGILDTSYQKTRQLWLEEYGDDYYVEGGMYRGEPPAAFFSNKGSPTILNSTDAAIQTALEMGASSTSPNTGEPPTKWAKLEDMASDGQPAYIPVNTTLRSELKDLPKRENYVLGKSGDKVGYFHLETWEAHQILCFRLEGRANKLQSDIAMEKCCCGSPVKIERLERELQETHETRQVVADRMNASKPTGVVRTSNITGSTTRRRYYDDSGVWLYPAFFWDTAGGACGGNVAGDAGGASGCGGACGGAGCGGGGCGGGGCGGGGCG